MLNSQVIRGRQVPFPAFAAERVYMKPFFQAQGLGKELAHWQPTVDAMLTNIKTDKPIYLMIDQREVSRGEIHRRPGAHTDGNWIANISTHGSPGHSQGGGGRHGGGRHGGGRHINASGYHDGHSIRRDEGFRAKGDLLLLASDVMGCEALVGKINGYPDEQGSVDHLDLSGLRAVPMTQGYVWYGDALQLVHRSLPQRFSGPRTVVRLNVTQ